MLKRATEHGTVTSYNYGCRCEPCREARAAVRRRHRDHRDLRYRGCDTPGCRREASTRTNDGYCWTCSPAGRAEHGDRWAGGPVIRQALAERGLNQTQAALAIGTRPMTLNETITGNRGMTAERAVALEEVIGVSAITLMYLHAERLIADARRARR